MLATSGVSKALKTQALDALGRLKDRSILGPLKACIRDPLKSGIVIHPFEGSLRDLNYEQHILVDSRTDQVKCEILGLIGTIFK